MQRIISSVLLSLMLVLSTALAQEGENSVGIPIIEAGQTISASFSGTVTAHLYAFEGTAGDTVSISMTQASGSDLDPFLVLLGARGQVIASDDDSGSPLFAALIQGVSLPEDGAYFIVASSFIYIDDILTEEEALSEEQPYELLLSGANRPASDTTPTTFDYFSGRLELGSDVEGASTLEEPVYYFTFNATVGDIVTIEMNSDEFDTLLYLFGAGGERLAVNDDDSETMTTNSAIRSFTIPATGRYMIFATDVFYYRANAGEDSLLTFEGGRFRIKLTAEDLVG